MKLFLILIVLSFAGCEQLTDTGDLPYTKQIVIHYFLAAGEKPSGEITHTVPLNVVYSDSTSRLKDGTVTLPVDGRVYQLEGGPAYWTDSLIIVEGKTYTLDVVWEGLHAHAVTTVPVATPLDSALIDTVLYRFDTLSLDTTTTLLVRGTGFFRPVRGYTYGVYFGALDHESLEPFLIPGSPYLFSESAVGNLQSLTSLLYSTPIDTAQYYLDLLTFTLDYYNFSLSFHHRDDNGFYSSSELNPNWNIEGDGIGYFAGYARSKKLLRFK